MALPVLVLVHGGGLAADSWELTVDEIHRFVTELTVVTVTHRIPVLRPRVLVDGEDAAVDVVAEYFCAMRSWVNGGCSVTLCDRPCYCIDSQLPAFGRSARTITICRVECRAYFTVGRQAMAPSIRSSSCSNTSPRHLRLTSG